jgi:hypothetical protein
MALLAEAQRSRLWRAFMRRFSDHNIEQDPLPLTKAQLRAVVDAVDAWCDANTASFNAAIPQPQRGLLSANQKAKLLMYVVWQRAEDVPGGE